MIDRVCHCGGNKYSFLGIQQVPSATFFLKLYNCLKCRTTVSEKINHDNPSIHTTGVSSHIVTDDRRRFHTLPMKGAHVVDSECHPLF